MSPSSGDSRLNCSGMAALVRHFLALHATHTRHPRISLTRGALALLATKQFAGNLHQLAPYLESLLVIAPPGDLIIDEGVVAKHEVRHRAATAVRRARGDREHAAAAFGTSVPRLEYWLRVE